MRKESREIPVKGIVLTSAAGLANAGCRRFDAQFGFIKSVHFAVLYRTVITVILLGIAAIGASFRMKALLQHSASSTHIIKLSQY